MSLVRYSYIHHLVYLVYAVFVEKRNRQFRDFPFSIPQSISFCSRRLVRKTGISWIPVFYYSSFFKARHDCVISSFDSATQLSYIRSVKSRPYNAAIFVIFFRFWFFLDFHNATSCPKNWWFRDFRIGFLDCPLSHEVCMYRSAKYNGSFVIPPVLMSSIFTAPRSIRRFPIYLILARNRVHTTGDFGTVSCIPRFSFVDVKLCPCPKNGDTTVISRALRESGKLFFNLTGRVGSGRVSRFSNPHGSGRVG